MKKEKILNENEIELDEGSVDENAIEDPNVIHIHDHDYERVKNHDEDEDDNGNFFERFFGKRPSERALRKLAIASFILGVLSCSLLLGNLITSVLGILLAVKNERHKYRSTFSTVGFILSAIGLILGAILTGVIILIPIALLTVVLLMLLLVLLAVLLILIILLGIGLGLGLGVGLTIMV